MGHEVFVSYSSKDKTIADAVVASLENNNIRCWYAPRDIRSGDDWGNAITHAVEGAKLFLLIFSGHSNQSQRVLDELNLAISCEITILPFRIENLEPEGAMRLHLTSRHWLDAFDPSWENNLQKLIGNVSASLNIALQADEIKFPVTGQRKKDGSKAGLTSRIVVGVLIAAVVIFAGWYGLTKLITPEEILSSSAETESSPTSAPNTESDWKTADFIIPNDGLWQKKDGSYTAIGSADTIAWTKEEYTGDIEISFDVESPNSYTAANVIVYGNGMFLSRGNLIFTLASDLLAISKDSIYGNDVFLFDLFTSTNFVDEKHTGLITIIDRKATLYMDGYEVSSVFLNDEINTSGKIGLLKYWEIDEVTFSNIQIKGTEITE